MGNTVPTIGDVRRDWRLLDDGDFRLPARRFAHSHEAFSGTHDIQVDHVKPGSALSIFRKMGFVFASLYALQLLLSCRSGSVLILNGGSSLWVASGILNRALFNSNCRILCWDVFVEVGSGWKASIARMAMRGMSISVLWSEAQIQPHATFLGIPEDRFLFLPYKANHSKGTLYSYPSGNFVFSGGNGKRDYACLVDAVRGTGIPVIISATDPRVRGTIEPCENVITLAASEPAFAQLQAASRFVVVPMVHTGLKGGGEANFCNAMWHGKPVIAADSIAAKDYIIDGVTGYVVPSGDSQLLRERIIELWENPTKAAEMGAAARKHVLENFTHDAFIRRLLRLALLLGNSNERDNESKLQSGD